MSLTDPLQVWPFWLERQVDPASPDFVPGSAAPPTNLTHRSATTIGTLGRPERAAVDPRGLVAPDHAGWSVDWWVGAEDHWHLPSRSASVRQRLVGDVPVVETAMRVPGGDVVHRAYGFLSTGLGPCAAIEVENRSAVPVALALAVRPYHPLGVTDVRSVAVDGAAVHVDGRLALVLDREPADVRTGDSVTGDVAGPLLAGAQAGGGTGADPGGPDLGGRATVAVVVPLPHTAVVRAVVPLAPERGRRGGPVPGPVAAVPAAEQVAKGWEAQLRRGLQVELPDERWQRAVTAAVAHLLLAHGGEDVVAWPAGPPPELADMATVLGALGHWGFADEVAEVLTTWPERQSLDGAFAGRSRRADAAAGALAAVADHWRLTGSSEAVEGLVGPVAKAVRWIARRHRARRPGTGGPGAAPAGLLRPGGARPGGGPPGTYLRDAALTARALAGVAEALDAAGQPGVADDARRLAGTLRDELDAIVGALVPGGTALPAALGRPVDAGVVVNVDLFEPFGVLAADSAVARATLDAVRALPAGGVAAVPRLDGPAGLDPALTAQLATLELDAGDARALDRLSWLIGAGGPVAAWPAALHPRTGGGSRGAVHDPVVTASFLVAVRRLLVRERPGGGLALCSVLPPDWWGRSLDVRRAPTELGLCSYSLRWHGERPALLWEIEPHAHVGDVVVSAPGLDPAWSSPAASGEALLAPVPAPAPGAGGDRAPGTAGAGPPAGGTRGSFS